MTMIRAGLGQIVKSYLNLLTFMLHYYVEQYIVTLIKNNQQNLVSLCACVCVCVCVCVCLCVRERDVCEREPSS